MSGHLLRNKEQICIHTRLCDAHVYIINKWVIDFLNRTDGFSTLKGELLPYIVKKQLSRANVIGEQDKLTSVINANTKVDEIFNVSKGAMIGTNGLLGWICCVGNLPQITVRLNEVFKATS